MSWSQAFRSVLGSATIVSMTGGVLATGSYILYKDKTRISRMKGAYENGSVLAPLDQNDCEVTYFRRPELEKRIRGVLRPKLTNEYYLIYGETGSGKTRTIVEIVRDMIKDEGKKHEGAPIYVQSVQGKTFPESLAKAVKFHFDEHVKFAFFLDFIMGIHSFPSRDDNKGLVRVLGAIETSAFSYMKQNGRPIVLVLDGVDGLNNSMPGALEKLQEKAKLWADANIAKVVFISNDEETISLLQKCSSNWSRAGAPIVFDDMTTQEAIEFLRFPYFMENSKEPKIMSMEEAKKIAELVGGHIHHLIICKRNWISGISYEDTANDLKMREKEKFVSLSLNPALWKAVSKLRNAEKKRMFLSQLIKETSEAAVQSLAKKNIILYRRRKMGTTVHFQTRLTENVVEEFKRFYDKKNLVKPKATEVQPQHAEVPAEMVKSI